jgi:uncharacterized protein (TIGR03437 family)
MRWTLIVFVSTASLLAQAPPKFTAIDLGILPGKAISQATAISSAGTVVGYSATAGFTFDDLVSGKASAQGWIYAGGSVTPMSIDGPSIPLGINASGQVVGITAGTSSISSFNFAPFFYLNGALNTPNGFQINNVCPRCPPDTAEPVAISDTGVVALTSNPQQSVVAGDAGPFMEAGTWTSGTITALPIPSNCPPLMPQSGLISNPNFCLSKVVSISGNGQYLSGYIWYWNQHFFEPALWGNGQLTTYGTGGFIAAVNNAGQGVGVHAGHAMIFSAGTTSDLGSGWAPVNINNNGWIVGNDQGYLGPGNLSIQPVMNPISAGSANAILWMNGTRYNLNTCSCINNAAGWEFDFAYAVNDSGQIVGVGYHNRVQTGFLLTPNAAPAINAVVNGASFAGGAVVPGEIATVFGTNLTSSTGINLTSSLPLPTAFVSDSLMVNNQAVALFAVDNVNGQQQINFQVPWEVSSGPNAMIAVSNNGTASAAISVPVLAAQPGIFNYNVGGTTFGAILHANFQLADTGHPAKAGETVLIYCTGLGAVSSPPADGAAGNGQTTRNPATVTIGGKSALVTFSGLAPGFVGLYQINAEVPAGLNAGNQPVALEIAGASSNTVMLPVQ